MALKDWKKFSEREDFIGFLTESRDKEISIQEGIGKDKNKWWLKIVDMEKKRLVTDRKGLKKSAALSLAKSYMRTH